LSRQAARGTGAETGASDRLMALGARAVAARLERKTADGPKPREALTR
jgi:hypothetical protein